jgi:hypothetical protein
MREMPIWIHTLTSGRHITDLKYTEWLNAEREYLQSKVAEPQVDALGVEYVDLLTKYDSAQ